MFHILKSKQLEIYEMQEGGGQPHIYPKNFDNWEIPLPPLEIQDQIVKEIEESIIETIKPYKGTRLESHKKNNFNSFNIFTRQ